jgi:ABC-2 type transport system permease protein
MKTFLQGLKAIALKECLHTIRDRLTMALLITVPLVQLILFGFAIDLHPRHLPTVLIAQEDDAFTKKAVNKLESLEYFKVVEYTNSHTIAERLLAKSKVQFMIELPAEFGAKLLLEEKPEVTLTADATDPIASIAAVQALNIEYQDANTDLPIMIKTKLAFNPSGASRLFIIPGLLGVILTLSMVLLGALTIVREYERGTLETLNSIHVLPSILLIGKAIPYFIFGCLMFIILLLFCTSLLDLPWPGWSAPLYLIAFIFIAANLMVGMMFSLIAKNSMQAMQLSIFFYLPSMLLSGFMFPFYGMPKWAQWLGELLPLTHFLRIVRGILLKGLQNIDAWSLAYPILLFGLFVTFLSFFIYHKSK